MVGYKEELLVQRRQANSQLWEQRLALWAVVSYSRPVTTTLLPSMTSRHHRPCMATDLLKLFQKQAQEALGPGGEAHVPDLL